MKAILWFLLASATVFLPMPELLFFVALRLGAGLSLGYWLAYRVTWSATLPARFAAGCLAVLGLVVWVWDEETARAWFTWVRPRHLQMIGVVMVGFSASFVFFGTAAKSWRS